VWKVAGGRENGDFEISFELAEATKLFDRRNGSLLSPHQKRGLAQAPERVTHIDVEIAGQERRRSMTGTALM